MDLTSSWLPWKSFRQGSAQNERPEQQRAVDSEFGPQRELHLAAKDLSSAERAIHAGLRAKQQQQERGEKEQEQEQEQEKNEKSGEEEQNEEVEMSQSVSLLFTQSQPRDERRQEEIDQEAARATAGFTQAKLVQAPARVVRIRKQRVRVLASEDEADTQQPQEEDSGGRDSEEDTISVLFNSRRHKRQAASSKVKKKADKPIDTDSFPIDNSGLEDLVGKRGNILDEPTTKPVVTIRRLRMPRFTPTNGPKPADNSAAKRAENLPSKPNQSSRVLTRSQSKADVAKTSPKRLREEQEDLDARLVKRVQVPMTKDDLYFKKGASATPAEVSVVQEPEQEKETEAESETDVEHEESEAPTSVLDIIKMKYHEIQSRKLVLQSELKQLEQEEFLLFSHLIEQISSTNENDAPKATPEQELGNAVVESSSQEIDDEEGEAQEKESQGVAEQQPEHEPKPELGTESELESESESEEELLKPKIEDHHSMESQAAEQYRDALTYFISNSLSSPEPPSPLSEPASPPLPKPHRTSKKIVLSKKPETFDATPRKHERFRFKKGTTSTDPIEI